MADAEFTIAITARDKTAQALKAVKISPTLPELSI
jgi:hypothetical protein